MAPASCSTSIAHARKLRIAGRRSRVNIMTIAPERDESIGPAFRSGLLTQGRDSKLGSCRLSTCSASLCKHEAAGFNLSERFESLPSFQVLGKAILPLPEHSAMA
jgi:hypothetical protein